MRKTQKIENLYPKRDGSFRWYVWTVKKWKADLLPVWRHTKKMLR